jgi:hypothetical protein
VFGGDARSKEFMGLIISYNAMFTFTSLGAKVDNSINTGDGPYVFKINGEWLTIAWVPLCLAVARNKSGSHDPESAAHGAPLEMALPTALLVISSPTMIILCA